MNANAANTDEIGRIDISNHAQLRAMQRLGAVLNPVGKVRELLAEAEPVDAEYVKGGQAWKVGSVTIVTDSDAKVVQTVFEKEGGR